MNDAAVIERWSRGAAACSLITFVSHTSATNASLCACLPNMMGRVVQPARPITSAMRSPSLPSPRMATRSPGVTSPCSTIRHAAANGSTNTACTARGTRGGGRGLANAVGGAACEGGVVG